jgi:hypothetical protein
MSKKGDWCSSGCDWRIDPDTGWLEAKTAIDWDDSPALKYWTKGIVKPLWKRILQFLKRVVRFIFWQ